jgi:hypothetical protein
MRRRSVLALVFSATVVFAPLRAQAQNDPPPPANLYTLHVYANLMQFPTIVLGPDFKPMKPVPREKFNVTIDGGPVFHPTKMRIEGDDPISLAVLLDAGGEQSGVLRDFTKSFAQLIPGSLHPQDRVSMYAVDCTVMRSLKDEPAVDSEKIANSITDALAAPGLHGKKAKPSCGYNLHLWDAMMLVAQDLGTSPSRRVLLVVSLGRENGSKSSLDAAAEYLSGQGVAVFGLRDNPGYEREDNFSHFGGGMGRRGSIGVLGNVNQDDLFSVICGRNGGMILDASTPGVPQDLKYLIDVLRGRYIIEYPRPDDKTAAVHSIDISVDGIKAFVRPTGGSSPIPDPAIANDPNTLPTAPSPAKVGTRRRPQG